ncbi:hypothetical protein TC41_2483 [Alicyclobacillus acidocaldarius subsp. acidocaldarius Tc-4-1]|uniref:Uncharacterized protein n=1 Tax=Alicyclobacillus acidocaldarius (strain Tc-4-1) TaxID=1048834 RepID=F8IH29_ALIAT|nr:hypothetical protein TC41_2483 [Alicyclobacillus acidocaldarius subsp. acidocaldarius Tc-4-1]
MLGAVPLIELVGAICMAIFKPNRLRASNALIGLLQLDFE